MKNNAKTGLMLGRLTPHQDGPAGMILKPVRDEIIDGLNSFRNPKFLVKFMGDDGVSTITKECDVVMTPRGYSVMIDLNEIVWSKISDGGGSGLAVWI